MWALMYMVLSSLPNFCYFCYFFRFLLEVHLIFLCGPSNSSYDPDGGTYNIFLHWDLGASNYALFYEKVNKYI